jgi:hypothetical protein
MSARFALLLAALVFLVTLLVRLPAGVLLAHLPGTLQCSGISGTMWRGSCGELAFGPRRVSEVRWLLHPASLLRARVALDLSCADPAATGQAYLEWSPGGELLVEHLAATLGAPLLTGLLPGGWSASMQLAIGRARARAGHLVAIEGTAQLQQLRAPRIAFGSYELAFAPAAGAELPAGAPMQGTLRDLEGPLSLRGIMRLTPEGRYELSAKLAAHEDASPALQQLLELLGPPDAQGARDFSFAGTL